MSGFGREREIARFVVKRRDCLGPEGEALGPLPDFARDRTALVDLHSAMTLTRAVDAKAVALQRTGRLGTYASSLGQEAAAVGVASAMRPEDVLLPSFREHGAQFVRGVSLLEHFLFWGGDERGADYAVPREDLPVCVPVGDQFAHAAGVGLAFSLRDERRVAVVFGGDGATSKGDFHEAMNLVGVWALPVVFVINNNQWAISMPRAEQSAAETLAQKAVGAGLPGEQVDGCDVIAVRAAAEEAIGRARDGDGGSVIECLSYRLADHTTADDATRYREDEEVSAAWPLEPLRRLRAHLEAAHGWTAAEEEALRADVKARIEEAAEAYLAAPPQPATSIVDHLFAELPADLVPFRAALEGGSDG